MHFFLFLSEFLVCWFEQSVIERQLLELLNEFPQGRERKYMYYRENMYYREAYIFSYGILWLPTCFLLFEHSQLCYDSVQSPIIKGHCYQGCWFKEITF